MDGCPWCVDRYVKDSYFECPFLPMKSDTSKYHSNHFTDIVADFHEDRQPLTGEHYVTIAEVKLSLSSAGTRLIFLWLFRGNAESGQRVVCWKVSALVSKTNENVTLLNQPWCSPTIQYIHSMSKTARSSRTEKVCYLCFIVTWHTHTHTQEGCQLCSLALQISSTAHWGPPLLIHYTDNPGHPLNPEHLNGMHTLIFWMRKVKLCIHFFIIWR